ncbi:hypothetical protein LCGC14_2722340, partial [marine sediment metagenome]
QFEEGIDLRSLFLGGIILKEATLKKAQLEGVQLFHADLERSFLEYANLVSENMYMNLGIGVFFIVSFIALSGYTETKNAFASASFITMLLAIIFQIVGVVSEYLVIVSVFLTALSAFYLFRDR